MTDDAHEDEVVKSDAVAAPVERMVMWNDAEIRPLCKTVDDGRFVIDIDWPIEIAVKIGCWNSMTVERYIASISDSGEMEDSAGNGLGFNWDDIWMWKELDELPTT